MNDDWVAGMDQLKAAMTDFAQVMHNYRRDLLEAGFDEREAMEISIAFQRDVFNYSSGSST